MPTLLVLSAYDTDSHRRLREGLAEALPAFAVETVALPPRHYAWRAGGSALAFADAVPRRPFDVLLAMGPVDLSALLGLRPELAGARRLLYVHEHEFAYPDNPREQGRVDRQMRQLLALLAADVVLTNSRWCADSLLDGAGRLLARMPDAVPAGTLTEIAGRIVVEPVPLPDALFAQARPSAPFTGDRVEIVWNHRHEWDKGPDRLPPLLETLHAAGLPFRFHLLGRRFRAQPPALAEVEAFLDAHPRHRGETGRLVDEGAYRARLAAADVVLSTALQEFQGLAVMEAVVCGCVPCVPDRLAYRDWVPAAFRAPSAPDDPVADGRALGMRIIALAEAARRGERPTGPALEDHAWSRRAARWRALLDPESGPGEPGHEDPP